MLVRQVSFFSRVFRNEPRSEILTIKANFLEKIRKDTQLAESYDPARFHPMTIIWNII